ncbi:17979_t:CDS:1, partial [Cetraspora pellucida]
MGGDLYSEPKEEQFFITALNNYHNNSTSESLPLFHNSTSDTRQHISRPKTHPSISNNKPSVILEVCPSSEYQPHNITVPPQDNYAPNCAQDVSETSPETCNSGCKSDICGSSICNSGCESDICGSSICNSGSDNYDLRNGSNTCTSGNEPYNCNLDEFGKYIETNSRNLKDGSKYYDSENRSNSHNLDNGSDYFNSETVPNNCDSRNKPEKYTP